MKKLAASVLVLSFVAVAAGCDKSGGAAPATSSTAAATAPAGSAAPATSGSKAGSGW